MGGGTYRVLHDLPKCSLIRCSDNLDDGIQLVVVVASSEQRHTGNHLGETAQGIRTHSQQDQTNATHMHPALQISILVL